MEYDIMYMQLCNVTTIELYQVKKYFQWYIFKFILYKNKKWFLIRQGVVIPPALYANCIHGCQGQSR